MRYIGIDGCRRGWFFAHFDGSKLNAGISESLPEIIDAAKDGATIMVDIPIGLRDDTPLPRSCDTAARKMLGPGRASSVFPAPIRSILREPTYADASAKSRELIGKGISQQSFAIIPKIREADELLATSTRARRSLREIHPEVCFCALNGGSAMSHTKKSKEGFSERMALIKAYLPGATEMAEQVLCDYRRKDVAKDDIADALVALVTAMSPADELRTLPEKPELDSRNIPMEMVYRNVD